MGRGRPCDAGARRGRARRRLGAGRDPRHRPRRPARRRRARLRARGEEHLDDERRVLHRRRPAAGPADDPAARARPRRSRARARAHRRRRRRHRPDAADRPRLLRRAGGRGAQRGALREVALGRAGATTSGAAPTAGSCSPGAPSRPSAPPRRPRSSAPSAPAPRAPAGRRRVGGEQDDEGGHERRAPAARAPAAARASAGRRRDGRSAWAARSADAVAQRQRRGNSLCSVASCWFGGTAATQAPPRSWDRRRRTGGCSDLRLCPPALRGCRRAPRAGRRDGRVGFGPRRGLDDPRDLHVLGSVHRSRPHGRHRHRHARDWASHHRSRTHPAR